MGVHGLTTYLRENQRVLGKTVQFPPGRVSGDVVTTIVVDGWSFIYELYEQSRLPWVYGGEYKAFGECVEQVVRAWIAIGLRVYFVFDGPAPELKIPTLISRLNRTNVERPLLFFRTSPTSRSTSRFLHENRILPPLVYQSCVHALRNIASTTASLEVHIADEEGDPYAVELAGRLGAYVVGNDSDFVILNSGRYAGSISLNEMLWTVPLSDETASTNGGGNEGFQTVVNSKTKKRFAVQQRTEWGLIPPDNTPSTDLTLSVTVYTPSALAAHLKLPVTLLPLLASLVGNDFSNHSSTQRNVQSLFFERSLTLSQRITHTANTLFSILNASTQRRKARHQVGSVMDLIDRTVNALLIRAPSSMATGEVDATVDRIVNAALQYAIDKYDGDVYGPASLWPTKICALHGEETCPLPTIFSRARLQNTELGSDDGPLSEASVTLKLRAMYIQAFRSGKLQPRITDVLSTGTFWPKIFLENPDVENVAKSIGRPIRRWIYALLEDAVGLPEAPEEEPPIEDGSIDQDDTEEEDPDELIDVVEEYSDDDDTDLLAPLRGELQRLRATDDSSEIPTSASSRSRSRPPPRPKCVMEYIRRGSRIASEEVPVPDLAVLMSSSGYDGNVDPEAWVPIQLRSVNDRMALFLHILGSNVPAVRNLPSDRLMAALVLRWVVQSLHLRALESGMSKDREKERWTRQEARAFLAFYVGSSTANATIERSDNSDTNVPITDRNIQLVAQVLMAMETIHLLSQVLFLSEEMPANVQTLSGLELHSYLTGVSPVPANALPDGLWEACMPSLEGAFGEEKQRKQKKQKTGQSKQVPRATHKEVMTSRQGLFRLLADQEA